MDKISEYRTQFYVKVCCGTFNANNYLSELSKSIEAGLKDESFNVSQMKLYAHGEESSLLSEPDREDLPVVLNVSASCPAQVLERIVASAVGNISEEFQLSATIFSKECISVKE